jgi:hypothetical protein
MVRKEKPQGYHWAELVRPVTELEDHGRDEDEDGQSLERMHDELTQAARRPQEQPREHRPQLHQEQRDGDRAAEDVQPLRELVEAHWAGRQRQPARRVLRWLQTPVRKATEKVMPSHRPTRLVTSGPRSRSEKSSTDGRRNAMSGAPRQVTRRPERRNVAAPGGR